MFSCKERSLDMPEQIQIPSPNLSKYEVYVVRDEYYDLEVVAFDMVGDCILRKPICQENCAFDNHGLIGMLFNIEWQILYYFDETYLARIEHKKGYGDIGEFLCEVKDQNKEIMIHKDIDQKKNKCYIKVLDKTYQLIVQDSETSI